jgi:L-lysine 2,3-aminomutase
MLTEPTSQPINIYSDWKAELSNCISSIDQLLQLLGLNSKDLNASQLASQGFSIKVPQHYAQLMEYGNPEDPLLKQVLPIEAELKPDPSFNNRSSQ